MPTVSKQPSELFDIYYDFDDILNDTESLTLLTCSASVVNKDDETPTNNILVTDSLSVVGTKLYITITGGAEDESPYKITLLAGTDEDHIYEYDVYIVVEEL